MRLLLTLALLLAAGPAALAAPARADFFVAPNGKDSWSGTLVAPNASRTDGPFATLPRARDAVRRRIAAGLKQNVRVLVRAGTYYLPQGLALGPEDSGTAAHSVIYAAYPGETPALIGGVRVSGWTRYRGDIWRARLPEGVTATRQVFENGERRTLARTPNTGYLNLEAPVKGRERRAFTYKAGDLDPGGWDAAEARVFLWPGHDWFSADKPLVTADAATRTVTLGTDEGYAMEPNNRYFVQNVLQLLDAPGECAIRNGERAVYLWPKRTPIERQAAVVSTAPSLIAAVGKAPDRPVRNVHFEGLDLSIANGDVVRFEGAEDCSVRFCTIENGQARGVAVTGHAQRVVVYGNLIRYNGFHGVALNGLPPGSPDVNKGHRVENNHIHHCGRLVGHGYGVEISQSGHNQVLHNHIHHLPRYATTIKGLRYQSLKESVPGVTWENHWDFLHGRNNRIAFNHIHDVNEDSQDTGAMESWGPGRDNVYDHNLIHDVGNRRFDLQSGLYLDDATDYFTISNNIIYNVRGAGGDQPIFVKGIGNKIVNNILIVEPTNAGGIRSLFMADERTDHHEYVRNIIAFEPAPPGGSARTGAWGRGIGNIHDPGTRRSWKVTIPASGAYDVYLRYAADNVGGAAPMDNRTTLAVDGGAPVPLTDLPNTGGWGTSAWSPRPSARLRLTKGVHTITWTNVKGGGLNWDGFVLTDDPAWRPVLTEKTTTDAGRNLVAVQAEAHLDPPGTVSRRPVYDFNNWSDDRVAASDANVFWNPGGEITVKGGPAANDWTGWRALFGGKFDRRSVVADPRFVNPAKRDYRLRPDSPALKLGFRNIDTRAIGLKADFPKRFARK